MAENITAEQEVYEVDKLTLLDCKKIRLAKEESGFLTPIMRAGLITR